MEQTVYPMDHERIEKLFIGLQQARVWNRVNILSLLLSECHSHWEREKNYNHAMEKFVPNGHETIVDDHEEQHKKFISALKELGLYLNENYTEWSMRISSLRSRLYEHVRKYDKRDFRRGQPVEYVEKAY